MGIATVEAVELGGVRQWLVVRGRERAKGVLLFLHGGPGTPESAWLAHYAPALEEHFVVVSWEQRGAGKSYAAGLGDPDRMTAAQLLADTGELTRHLKERFGQERVYLVGHSWGCLLGIRAAARWPGDYAALVSVAQPVHAVREEAAMHAWVLRQARRDGNRRAVRQLEALPAPAPGSLSLRDLSVRLRWVERYGGGVFHRRGARRELARVLLRSRVYRPGEKLRYLRAERFSLAHLYRDMVSVDLFEEITSLAVPAYFVHGRHDYQVPLEVTRDYYERLEAPHKELAVFGHSAHSPLFEEPERFVRLVCRVAERHGRAVAR